MDELWILVIRFFFYCHMSVSKTQNRTSPASMLPGSFKQGFDKGHSINTLFSNTLTHPFAIIIMMMIIFLLGS